jgi:hypothetical protein
MFGDTDPLIQAAKIEALRVKNEAAKEKAAAATRASDEKAQQKIKLAETERQQTTSIAETQKQLTIAQEQQKTKRTLVISVAAAAAISLLGLFIAFSGGKSKAKRK